MEEEVQDTPPRQRRAFPAAAAIGWSILPITEHRGEKRLVWKDRQGPEEPGLATSFTGPTWDTPHLPQKLHTDLGRHELDAHTPTVPCPLLLHRQNSG